MTVTRTATSMLAFGVACLSQQVWAGDVDKGRKVAELHCSRCHVVGDFNKNGGIASTPSFQMLVKRRRA